MDKRSSSKRRSKSRQQQQQQQEGGRAVRFRSETSLVSVKVLPEREQLDARRARVGKWGVAPEDDIVWNGHSFREKELTVEELALERKKNKRKKSIISSIFGSNLKKKVERELAEQGSYRYESDNSVEYYTDSESESESMPPQKHKKPLKSALKKPKSRSGLLGQEAVDYTVRAYRASLKNYAARRKRYRYKSQRPIELNYFALLVSSAMIVCFGFLYSFLRILSAETRTKSDVFASLLFGILLSGFISVILGVLNKDASRKKREASYR